VDVERVDVTVGAGGGVAVHAGGNVIAGIGPGLDAGSRRQERAPRIDAAAARSSDQLTPEPWDLTRPPPPSKIPPPNSWELSCAPMVTQ